MTMRIIAGTARGRRLFTVPKTMNVKPISGRIRQSVFDILRPYVTGSHFLDLFAGTGAVGLEALSRGARLACFVDRDPRCIKAVERNLDHLGFKDQGRVFRGSVLGPLSWVLHRAAVEDFDIVFMGPPYRDERNNPLAYTHRTLQEIVAGKLLAKGGRVVAQHHKFEELESVPGLRRCRQEKYGDSLVTFYTLKEG